MAQDFHAAFGLGADAKTISASDISSPWFDAGLVWGPVSGRMFYAGVRYRL